MKKIHLLIMILAGIFSFVLSFGVNWFLQRNQPVLPEETTATPQELAQSPTIEDNLSSLPRSLNAASYESHTSGLTERQLQSLIEDIRSRMQEYRTREKELAKEAQRIELAHQSLQDEIDRLNQLRNKIAVLTQDLDDKEQRLKETLLQVESIEQTNFQRLAATYDKMDITQASRILSTMASGPQSPDAIKILYYMSERTSAKVLGEIGASQPELAALISMKLKRVQENG